MFQLRKDLIIIEPANLISNIFFPFVKVFWRKIRSSDRRVYANILRGFFSTRLTRKGL